MELDKDQMSKVSNRLKRAQGQLTAVVRMLDEGRDCEDVVTQLSAVSRALDRAGFAIIAAGMRQCLIRTEEGDDTGTLDVAKLEKLFLSLA
ncbi:metal-sensitive transcriptional regulator [Cellulomonas sp. McL0617]|uniref:metal-sensitive transcriptional regulator n=1 Tax=Cellulomonas sp. McL0617 TaxID=3415675 RepID=UPI003CEA4E18